MTLGEEPTDFRSPECLARLGTGHQAEHGAVVPDASPVGGVCGYYSTSAAPLIP
jgi:hypothetical protein